MSIVTAAKTWQGGPASRTVRQFSRAMGFAAGAIAFGCLVYVTEKYLLASRTRFVENPASVMMLACGLAHFLVGWLFLFTSPRLRNGRGVSRLLVLTAVGAGLCALCFWLGNDHNPLVYFCLYGYFLLHEIRDETNLYRAYGDAPRDGAGTARFLAAAQAAVVCLAVTMLAGGYLAHVWLQKRGTALADLPAAWFAGVFAALLLACALSGRRAWRVSRELYGSWPAVWQTHRPILTVYFVILGLVPCVVLGGFSFNMIILIHVGSWVAFALYRLRQEPAPPPANAWAWLRHTVPGFLTLHLSVIALILVLMALRVYIWDRTGFVCELVEGSNFSYWSLMHISMAFWKPAGK